MTGPALHPLRPQDYRLALVLALVLLVLGGWRMVPRVTGVFHDDAIYVITAKALAEGHGYRLINLPGAPRQTKYPILYPGILAVIWKIWPSFPDNLLAMQVLTLLSAAAALALMYLYLVRFGYCSRLTAGLAVLVSATTPTMLYVSGLALSEMLFAVLLVVALWRVELELRRSGTSIARQLVTGVVLAAPYYCRTVGLPVMVAALVVLAWHRKPVGWTAAACAAAVAPWIAWTLTGVRWQADPIIGYYTDYMAGWSPFSTQGLGVLAVNLLLVCRDSIALLLSPVSVLLNKAGIRIGQWLILPGAIVWFAIARRSLRAHLLPCCLLAYVLMISVWPWPPWRFLAPILPLLCVNLGQLVGDLVRPLLPHGRHRYALAGLAIIVLLLNVAFDVATGQISRRIGYPYHFAPSASTPLVSWGGFEETFRWVRSHVPENAVVASGLDSMLSLYTGRVAFRPWIHRPEALFYGARLPKCGTPEEFATILKTHRARYLVMFPLEEFSESEPFAALVQQVRAQYPELLTIVYQGADPRFAAYEVRLGS